MRCLPPPGLWLLLGLLVMPGCRRERMTARGLLELNVRVVRDREVEPFLEHAYKVARMVIDEPAWDGVAPGYNREDLLRRKAEYRGLFHRHTIRNWLVGHHVQGSDIAVAEVYEFNGYDEMVHFLGADPESAGVPVPVLLAARFPDHVPVTCPAERARFLGRMAVVHFGTALGPRVRERERRGQDWSGLRLLEETGIVDRWALGYVTARGQVRGRLLMRARGLWALWPLVR